MNATTTQHNLEPFLKLFSKQNNLRPTRIGVFKGEPGAMTDYWLEDGLPLAGISADSNDENLSIEIMLGDPMNAARLHLTHSIDNVSLVKIIASADGKEDGLEIKDTEHKTTILRFEN